MTIVINDFDVSMYITEQPIIQSTLAMNTNRAYIDYTEFKADNSTGVFIGSRAVLNNDINTVKIYTENTLLFSGYLEKLINTTENILRVVCKSEYGLKAKNNIKYMTSIRGDGTTVFNTAEYVLKGSDYYETPAYCLYHLLKIAGVDNFDMVSLSDANSNYTSDNIYMRLESEFKNYSLQFLINKLNKIFNLYFFTDANGNINFQFKKDLTEITLDNFILNKVDDLEFYNNYSIYDNSSFAVNEAGSYGSSYRTDTDKALIVYTDIIQIYDSTAANKTGQNIIDNFYKARKGFKLITNNNNYITENQKIKIDYIPLNYISKTFQIYNIKRNYNTAKMELIIYETI